MPPHTPTSNRITEWAYFQEMQGVGGRLQLSGLDPLMPVQNKDNDANRICFEVARPNFVQDSHTMSQTKLG